MASMDGFKGYRLVLTSEDTVIAVSSLTTETGKLDFLCDTPNMGVCRRSDKHVFRSLGSRRRSPIRLGSIAP